MDTLVFDIETKNFFTDPGVGWDNFAALEISVVGLYSYERDEYVCYSEHEMEQLAEYFKRAGKIVGFSINRYDVPVLHNHFARVDDKDGLDLYGKERIDLLEEVEFVIGKRISLENLSQANLGTGKTGHGAHAIELYKENRIDELKSYCLKDVELTKKLFDQFRIKKYFFIPDRDTGAMTKIFFNENSTAQNLF